MILTPRRKTCDIMEKYTSETNAYNFDVRSSGSRALIPSSVSSFFVLFALCSNVSRL